MGSEKADGPLLDDDALDEGASEFDEYEEEKEEQIDPEIVAMREEIAQLEGRVQEEKALSDKAESARRSAQEQMQANEEQLSERRKELNQIELECDQLMVEGRMYQLASREYDLPLKETWVDKPEQALVVDLSRIMRTLEQASRQIGAKSGPSGSLEAARLSEVEVVHVKADGLEISKTNIPVKSTSTVGEVLRAAASYWSLDVEQCELENSQGRKLVRKDAILADTRQLVLKDRLSDAEERALEDEAEDAAAMSEIGTTLRASEVNAEQLASDALSTSLAAGDIHEPAVAVQVGRESITRRDARFCHHVELLIVVLLATTFVAMSLEFRRVPEAFASRESVKRAFADQPVATLNASQPQFTFYDVVSEERMWLWLTQTNALYSQSAPLTSNCTGSDLNKSFALTALTLSQLRVPPNSGCTRLTVNGQLQTCYSAFNSPQGIVPYSNAASVPLSVRNAFEFNATQFSSQCTSWPALVNDGFTGLFNYYPAEQLNAYSIRLERGPAGMEQLFYMQAEGWVDDSTRLVTAEFSAVDQVSGAIVNVIAALEYLPSGAVSPKWISIPFFAQVNDGSYDLAFLILALILVCFSFLSALIAGIKHRLGALFLDSLILIFVVLYFAGNQQLDTWIQACQQELRGNSSSVGGAVDFRGPAFQFQLVGNLAGVIVVLFAIRLGKHINASPSASKLVRAFTKSIPQYISLFFMTALVAACFAMMAHFIFGRSSSDFFVGDLAFASLWISFSVGNSGAFVGVAQWGAIVLSIAAYIALFLVLLSMCFAVTAAAYMAVSDEVRSKGFHWIPGVSGASAFSKYAGEVVAPSGAVGGVDASERLEKFQASHRNFG